jgi:hypothetical protein
MIAVGVQAPAGMWIPIAVEAGTVTEKLLPIPEIELDVVPDDALSV